MPLSRTKEILINYRFLLRNVKALREGMERLQEQIDGLKAQDYTTDKITAHREDSKIEQMVIELVEKKLKLDTAETLLSAIEGALEELEDVDKEIIRLKYIDKNTWNVNWNYVADKVGYSKKQCIRRRDKALKRIEVVLDGIV